MSLNPDQIGTVLLAASRMKRKMVHIYWSCGDAQWSICGHASRRLRVSTDENAELCPRCLIESYHKMTKYPLHARENGLLHSLGLTKGGKHNYTKWPLKRY